MYPLYHIPEHVRFTKLKVCSCWDILWQLLCSDMTTGTPCMIVHYYLLSHLCKKTDAQQFCGTAQRKESPLMQTTLCTNLLWRLIVFAANVQQVLNFKNVPGACICTHLHQRHGHGLERLRYDFKSCDYSLYSLLPPCKCVMFHFVSTAHASHQKTVFGAKWRSIMKSLKTLTTFNNLGNHVSRYKEVSINFSNVSENKHRNFKHQPVISVSYVGLLCHPKNTGSNFL